MLFAEPNPGRLPFSLGWNGLEQPRGLLNEWDTSKEEPIRLAFNLLHSL
jgi:hypothetical protein